MESTHSQAFQDVFVYTMTKHKKNGTFLEIGANHPIVINNTYTLETKYNWRGIMIEYDEQFRSLYTDLRPLSTFLIQDATQINYVNLLEQGNYPKEMDYLQIDLEVENRSTLNTLELLDQTVFDQYKFATVTFEHDIYRGDFFDTRKISREIFQKRGYILMFPNVGIWQGTLTIFEDWYVHPDLVDASLIEELITTDSLSCNEIKNRLIRSNHIL